MEPPLHQQHSVEWRPPLYRNAGALLIVLQLRALAEPKQFIHHAEAVAKVRFLPAIVQFLPAFFQASLPISQSIAAQTARLKAIQERVTLSRPHRRGLERSP